MEEKFVITEIKRVIMVGKEEYPEKWTHFKGNLPYNELIFHFSGHARVFFGDLTLESTPMTIRFLPKGSAGRYDVYRLERGDCIDVFFSADRPLSPSAFVADAQSEKLAPLFKKLFATWVGKNEGYYFESISLLYKIFAEMQKSNSFPEQHFKRIKPAVDAIHDTFLENDFSAERLAAMCGMSGSYFQRLFKEKYGVAPKKYYNQLKINHACELLRLGMYSITQIAELSGFSDVYFFSRQFKEYMGITPTQFIEKYRSSK